MRFGSLLLPIGAAFSVFVLFQKLNLDRIDDPELVGIVVAALGIALAGMFSVPTNTGNRLTPSYIAVAALPIIANFDERETGGPSIPVLSRDGAIVAILVGLALLWVIRTTRGEDPRSVADRFVRRLAVFATYIYVYAALRQTMFLAGSDWQRLAFFVAALAGAFLVEVFVDVVFKGRLRGGMGPYALAASLTDGIVFMALMATGALFGISFEVIGYGAIAVAVLPYSFTAMAFRRLADSRRTYSQTIVALAQVPEAGGHTKLGHASRTNALAVAVARRIGVSPKEYEQINYASYLHDIGRITLNEPSILRQGFTDMDIARWGAEIVGQTPYLHGVAEAVRRQHEPFRSPGEVSNLDLPLASRIIKVCSAYDESVNEMGFSPLEAMERIHRGTIYDFDPDVAKQLREVLERRGAFNHPAAITPA